MRKTTTSPSTLDLNIKLRNCAIFNSKSNSASSTSSKRPGSVLTSNSKTPAKTKGDHTANKNKGGKKSRTGTLSKKNSKLSFKKVTNFKNNEDIVDQDEMINELFQPIRLQDYEEMVEFDSEDECSPKRAQFMKEREEDKLLEEKIGSLRVKKLIEKELDAKK